MENKTLLVIVPGQSAAYRDQVYYLVVAETGECLASHICSSSPYAMGDLYSNRPERIKSFGERFGEVEVKYIDETDINEEDLFERNQQFAKENADCE